MQPIFAIESCFVISLIVLPLSILLWSCINGGTPFLRGGVVERDLKSCELNFIAEAKPEDEIAIFADFGRKIDRCSVRRVSDSGELCRSELVWRR